MLSAGPSKLSAGDGMSSLLQAVVRAHPEQRLFPPSLKDAVEPLDFFGSTQFAVSPCDESSTQQHLANGGASPARFALITTEYGASGVTGTGSASWFYRACLLGAHLSKRTLVSAFCHSPACPLRQWSSCSADQLQRLVNGSAPVDVEECVWDDAHTMLPEASRLHYWGSRDTAVALAATVPRRLRARHGALVDTLLFWRAIGMSYFNRLNLGYDAQFQSLAQWRRPGFWPPGKRVATFHIRHDDKEPMEGRQIPMSEFMDALYKYHPDVAHVHVCTDDANVTSEFSAYPNITFLAYENAAADALDRNKKAPIFRDLYTLAMGDVFFGTYSSNYGMMAMDLHLLRTGFCSDLVMMDDWYHLLAFQYGHLIWNSTLGLMDLKVTRQKDGVNWFRDERLLQDPDYKVYGHFATQCRKRKMTLVAGRQLP